MHVNNATAQTMVTAVGTAIDAGTQALMRLYSGTPPADADASLSGNTLLAELTMSATAFGSATDANPGGRITANSITSDSSADATGTPTFGRIITQNGGTVVTQFTAGLSAAELILSASITAGSVVSVSSATITMPEGP